MVPSDSKSSNYTTNLNTSNLNISDNSISGRRGYARHGWLAVAPKVVEDQMPALHMHTTHTGRARQPGVVVRMDSLGGRTSRSECAKVRVPNLSGGIAIK